MNRKIFFLFISSFILYDVFVGGARKKNFR